MSDRWASDRDAEAFARTLVTDLRGLSRSPSPLANSEAADAASAGLERAFVDALVGEVSSSRAPASGGQGGDDAPISGETRPTASSPEPRREDLQTVGIIGLGSVGTGLAAQFALANHRVIGVDVDPRRVSAVTESGSGAIGLPWLSSEAFQAAGDRIRASGRYSSLSPADSILIAVPTTLTRYGEPDIGSLRSAASSLAGVIQEGQLVVLVSTAFPGMTREHLIPTLEESGFAAGRDFHVAYAPCPRVAGSETSHRWPQLVAGLTPACAARASDMLKQTGADVVVAERLEDVEIAKLGEALFVAADNAIANEVARIAEAYDIDPWDVADLLMTRVVERDMRPNPGVGGGLLPMAPRYLAWGLSDRADPKLTELVAERNRRQPSYCAAKTAAALNDRHLPVKDTHIVVVGVGHEPGSTDTRHSPALAIIGHLKAMGAHVSYHDEFVPRLVEFQMESQPLEDILPDCQCVVLVAAHQSVDINLVARRAPLIVDLQGAIRGLGTANVVHI